MTPSVSCGINATHGVSREITMNISWLLADNSLFLQNQNNFLKDKRQQLAFFGSHMCIQKHKYAKKNKKVVHSQITWRYRMHLWKIMIYICMNRVFSWLCSISIMCFSILPGRQCNFSQINAETKAPSSTLIIISSYFKNIASGSVFDSYVGQ